MPGRMSREKRQVNSPRTRCAALFAVPMSHACRARTTDRVSPIWSVNCQCKARRSALCGPPRFVRFRGLGLSTSITRRWRFHPELRTMEFSAAAGLTLAVDAVELGSIRRYAEPPGSLAVTLDQAETTRAMDGPQLPAAEPARRSATRAESSLTASWWRPPQVRHTGAACRCV
jgi:hypothetical protein